MHQVFLTNSLFCMFMHESIASAVASRCKISMFSMAVFWKRSCIHEDSQKACMHELSSSKDVSDQKRIRRLHSLASRRCEIWRLWFTHSLLTHLLTAETVCVCLIEIRGLWFTHSLLTHSLTAETVRVFNRDPRSVIHTLAPHTLAHSRNGESV